MTNPTKPASGGKKNRPGNAAKADSSADLRSDAAKAGSAKAGAAGAGTAKPATAKAGAKPAPNRAQSKKIVNQRQAPWGLIITCVVIVILAVGVVFYAVNSGSKKKSPSASNPDGISGIVHKTFASGDHKTGPITYQESPPMGGPHAPVWADCTGTVYPNQIASENAVHDLEHGAVWITYKPGLPADQLDVLTKLVSGQQYMLLTPYAGLKTNVSLQAWGYQLFLDSATDPRVAQFITDLKLNQKTTPELGASCTNATFKTNPSTPGHPVDS